MEALVKSIRLEQATLKKLYARKKINDARNFLATSKEKYGKAVQNIKLLQKENKKLKKEQEAKSADVAKAWDTVNNAKAEQLVSGMKVDKALSESIFDKENAEILSAKFGTGDKAGTPKPEAKDGLKGKIKAQEQDELKSEEEQAAKDNEKLLKANVEAESKTALTGVDKSKAKLIIEAQKQLDADSAANEDALKKAMDERAQYRRRIEQAGIELKQAKEENIHMFRQKFGVPQEQKK